MLAPFVETEVVILLFLAIIIAIIARKTKIPYTIALVFVGLIAVLAKVELVHLSKEMIFFLFLPPLLFEGAVHIHLEDLKENIATISILSIVGIAISVTIIGFGVSWLLGIPLLYGLLFGAIISPTDPVSVLALFKKLGVSKKLSTIVEGESLFNDGTGVVLYEIILGLILAHHLTVVGGIIEFFKIVMGGFAVGGLLGYLVYSMMKYIDDRLIEVLATIVLAYGAFILAEYLLVSGVIAVVVAGILIGNFGTRFAMSPTTRLSVVGFWEVIVFIVNSIIFILIGSTILVSGFSAHLLPIIIAILVVLISRSISVYSISNFTDLIKEKTPWSWQHVINWGGLHGSIPVALILGLQTLDIQYKEPITYMTFGVVFFSLVVQGLTMSPLIRKLGIISVDEEERALETLMARKAAAKKALAELKKAYNEGEISKPIYESVAKEYKGSLLSLQKNHRKQLEKKEVLKLKQVKSAKRRALLAEKSAIKDQAQKGLVSDEVGELLIKETDSKLDELE